MKWIVTSVKSFFMDLKKFSAYQLVLKFRENDCVSSESVSEALIPLLNILCCIHKVVQAVSTTLEEGRAMIISKEPPKVVFLDWGGCFSLQF